MMFTLLVETENAAFKGRLIPELRRVALASVEAAKRGQGGKVIDLNGNSVGWCSLAEPGGLGSPVPSDLELKTLQAVATGQSLGDADRLVLFELLARLKFARP